MAGSDEGVARVRLEYTQDGGARWRTEKDLDGTDIDFTGTALDPLVGLEVLTWIKNETPKPKVYRWNCVSMDRDVSAAIPWSLYNHIQFKQKWTWDTGILVDDEAPASGTDGDGARFAGAGSIYIDTNAGQVYRNDGNSTNPIWTGI